MRIVITDANVLINLAIADGLKILSRLPEFEFVVPEDVLSEITTLAQRRRVEAAVKSGALTRVRLDVPAALAVFIELRGIMGLGEAACLALAESNGWAVASDEKRAFHREAVGRLGPANVITTGDLYLLSIRAGIMSVAEADAAKAVLAANRFAMPFGSFQDLLTN